MPQMKPMSWILFLFFMMAMMYVYVSYLYFYFFGLKNLSFEGEEKVMKNKYSFMCKW
uniref:ATP synthase F0 subunit 8 n=1 Tax=Amblyseiulella paraheveae TaxID=3049516 RepID=A0AAU6PBE9_9ACAR